MSAGSTNTRQHWINAAAFIVMEVAALAMVGASSEIQRSWMGGMAHSVTAFFGGGLESVGRYFHLRAENELLAQQNLFLLQKVAGESESQVARTEAWTFLPAEIAKHQFKGNHSYYLLDKGSEDGVSVNFGVITPRGVVGIVDAVTPHYSYVRSFFSVGMTISAREDSTGVTAPMSWDGKGRNGAYLRSIPHHIVIPPGREIRTSPYSGLFPPDIPLGVTGESHFSKDGMQTIAVSLYEDPTRLRHVMIVRQTWREEIEKLGK